VAWTNTGIKPPIAAKQISGSGANLWFTGGAGDLVRFFGNMTTTVSTKAAPKAYITVNGNNEAYNMLDGDMFIFSGDADLVCSCVGSLYYAGWHIEGEVAYTRAYWAGTPAPTCVVGNPTQCLYTTVNNCTPATTPPDLNMIAVESGDYRAIATYLSWMNVAACLRFNYPGMTWSCMKALSFKESINAPMPPFACTYNP